MLNERKWDSESHKLHFESGVRLGIGTFNLVSDTDIYVIYYDKILLFAIICESMR